MKDPSRAGRKLSRSRTPFLVRLLDKLNGQDDDRGTSSLQPASSQIAGDRQAAALGNKDTENATSKSVNENSKVARSEPGGAGAKLPGAKENMVATGASDGGQGGRQGKGGRGHQKGKGRQREEGRRGSERTNGYVLAA